MRIFTGGDGVGLPLTGGTVAGTITIDQNSDAISLDIDSEATTADVINIAPTVLTTGNVIDIADADALTTGSIANFISNSADTGTRTLQQITNNNTLATGTTCLTLQQDANQRAFLLDQNGNGAALVIDSEATSSPTVSIVGATTTTANIIDIASSDSLTTGRMLSLASNSASTGTRFLAFIRNNNTLATGTTTLYVQQNAAQRALFIDQNALGPCLEMDVTTLDTGFLNFVASADADATSAISTFTTSGATTHHIQCEINGTTFWIAGSTTDPTA